MEVSQVNNVSNVQGLGQDAFLRLLTTQLQFQDPLSPMDNVEFITQLAQFSQLEQSTAMRGMLEKAVGQLDSLGHYNAAGLIGMEIEAEGRSIPFDGSTPAPLSYRLSEDAAQVGVLISDGRGQAVRVIGLGPQEAGLHTLDWDGRDASGNPMPQGAYFYDVVATDPFGVRISNTTYARGEIGGVTFEEGGVYFLVNGEKLPASDALRIGKGNSG